MIVNFLRTANRKSNVTAARPCVGFKHRYQAVYNYLPHNEDELELKEGDIVDVMEKCDDGWFVGKWKKKDAVCLGSDKHIP